MSPNSTISVDPSSIKFLSDDEICDLVLSNIIIDHQLEKLLDPHREVTVRCLVIDAKLTLLGCGGALTNLPSGPSLDYSRVFGANCEIVVGYVPIPVGMIGTLTLYNETVNIPMATTEGCLVESTNHGCKAISAGGGVISTILKDGITRAPFLSLPSTKEAAKSKMWCNKNTKFQEKCRAAASELLVGGVEGRKNGAGDNS